MKCQVNKNYSRDNLKSIKKYIMILYMEKWKKNYKNKILQFKLLKLGSKYKIHSKKLICYKTQNK